MVKGIGETSLVALSRQGLQHKWLVTLKNTSLDNSQEEKTKEDQASTISPLPIFSITQFNPTMIKSPHLLTSKLQWLRFVGSLHFDPNYCKTKYFLEAITFMAVKMLVLTAPMLFKCKGSNNISELYYMVRIW